MGSILTNGVDFVLASLVDGRLERSWSLGLEIVLRLDEGRPLLLGSKGGGGGGCHWPGS